MTDQRRAIRLGYHGSLVLPRQIVSASGRAADDVELHEYDVSDPFRGVRAGDLDVMIVKFTVKEPDLVYSAPLAYETRAALLGAGHPLADRESVSVEELADYPAFHCPGNFPGYVWDEVVPPVTPAGRPIHRQHKLTTTSSLLDLVARTDAVHLSLLSLGDIAPPGVRVIPIHDLPPAPVALARRHDLPPNHVHAFIADAEAAVESRPL